MDFYKGNLGVFVAINAFLLFSQYRATTAASKKSPSRAAPSSDLDREEAGINEPKDSATATLTQAAQRASRAFQLNFFVPYGLAVAADWLQGPHIYAIYKYEKNIPERMVAMLYAAGFVSGGVSASFAGQYADRFGRKRACILYCILYTLTCLTMLSDNLVLLFVGRLCGGVSTTLLFSVFEAWMISDYHEQGLQGLPGPAGLPGGHASDDDDDEEESSTGSVLELSAVFGTMTTLSCVVAIASGVIGDMLVQYSGTRTWPFLAAALCCVGAAVLISSNWRENYGSRGSSQTSLQDIRSGVLAIWRDPAILALGILTTVFEGTMYLFIFFWSAALQAARTVRGSSEGLPFGIIFSSFMCTMMAGSAAFSYMNRTATSGTTVSRSANVLLTTTLMVGCCLGLAVILENNEQVLFWVFCLLEGCIGIYFPAVASLKSELIDDGIRGRVYSILRFPLNVYVVVAHSLDEEGPTHRNHVFITCGVLLLIAFCVAKRNLPKEP